MIVVSANLSLIPKHFDPGVDRAIIQRCCAKFGFALGLPPESFARKVKEFRSFMKEINRPSKNTLTAMTRAVCYKYGVIAHQEPYFRDMNVPNPILQKNLREVMEHFLWDWEDFVDQYRVVLAPSEEQA
jgi:RNase adaptor protein for sRNA GlmZ degradation